MKSHKLLQLLKSWQSFFSPQSLKLINSPKLKHLACLLLILSFPAISFCAGEFQIMAQDLKPNEIFTDTKGHFAQSSIEKWNERGIVKGSDSKFRPDSPITRGEFAVIINRLLDFEYPSIKKESFTDLQDRFYTSSMLALNENKIMLGSNNQLRAEDPITREEAAVVILRAFQVNLTQGAIPFEDEQQISNWAKSSISFMANNGFMNGYENKIHPKKNITRGEFAKMLDNMISDYIEHEKYEIGSKQGFILVKSPVFQLKNTTLNHPIIFSGHVQNIEIEKSVISSKLVVINNLFKNIGIKESRISDMSSQLKNADIQIDKLSTLPKSLRDLKDRASGLNNVQIRNIEKESFSAPIANNDSDVYEPLLPNDKIQEQTPPKKKDEIDEAAFRNDLWIYIEGISNDGEIILQASDDLSNFKLPEKALILNAKNGENSGVELPLQWDAGREKDILSKLEDIRMKKIGQYAFQVQTLEEVSINETNYKRVKLNVIIKVIF